MKIAATKEAVDAALAFAERTDTCVQDAINDLPQELFHYCYCGGCRDQMEWEAASEAAAEARNERYFEDRGEPCMGLLLPDGGCRCC